MRKNLIFEKNSPPIKEIYLVLEEKKNILKF